MPHIPQDIIDVILNHLTGLHGSSAVLKTCALVSRCFRSHSQRLSFRSIMVDAVDWNPGPLSRLHLVLKANPHLGTHVRHLSLFLRPRGSSQISETLVDTLVWFTGVSSCAWIEHGVSGPSRENIRIRLYQFLRLPSLVKVFVQGADPVLIDFLASCEQLKSLTVNVCSVNLESISLGDASISPTHSTSASGLLEELIVDTSHIVALIHSLASQSSQLGISRLRKLTVARTKLSLGFDKVRKACQQVLDLCAESLEELTIGKHLHIIMPSLLSFHYRTGQPNVC